jgi:hypothetical protein
MRSRLLLALLTSLFACSSDPEPTDGGTSDTGAPSRDAEAGDRPIADAPGADAGIDSGVIDSGIVGTGIIVGQVVSPNPEGFDVIAGARVTIEGGTSTVTDDFGQFVFDAVPAGEARLLVEVPEREEGGSVAYGTTELLVDVRTGSVSQAFPTILKGCTTNVVGSGGSRVDFAGCGGGADVILRLPLRGVVTATGGVVLGAIRIEASALRPEVADDLSSLPPDPRPDLLIFGSAEIRLFDAKTRAPVNIATGTTATLRIETSTIPSDIDRDRVMGLRYDHAAGRWEEIGRGRWVVEGGRTFYEIETDHFSNHAVGCTERTPCGVISTPPPRACIDARALQVRWPCGSGTCQGGLVNAELRVIGTSYNRRVTGSSCLEVPENRGDLRLVLRHLEPLAVLVGAPQYYEGSVALPPAGALSFTCDQCVRLPQQTIDLLAPPLGCVRGQLSFPSNVSASATGSRILVKLDGDTIAWTFSQPDGSFCAHTHVGIPSLTLVHEASGYSTNFTPGGMPGATCSMGSCAVVGNAQLSCTGQRCIEARIRVNVGRFDMTSRSSLVRFDAGQSTGPISRYLWRVFRGTRLLPSALVQESPSLGAATWDLALGPDTYTVVLTAEDSFALGQRGYATSTFTVSETMPQGEMNFFVSDIGLDRSVFMGLAGADEFCRLRVQANMALPASVRNKTWVAYFSATNTRQGAQPIHARDRIGPGPFYDYSGNLIASDVAQLHTSGIPSSSIVDQFGAPIPPEERDILTGTLPDGTADSDMDWMRFGFGSGNCQNLTTRSDFATVLVGHADWDAAGSPGARSWNSSHRVYCLNYRNTVNETGMPAGRVYCFGN